MDKKADGKPIWYIITIVLALAFAIVVGYQLMSGHKLFDFISGEKGCIGQGGSCMEAAVCLSKPDFEQIPYKCSGDQVCCLDIYKLQTGDKTEGGSSGGSGKAFITTELDPDTPITATFNKMYVDEEMTFLFSATGEDVGVCVGSILYLDGQGIKHLLKVGNNEVREYMDRVHCLGEINNPRNSLTFKPTEELMNKDEYKEFYLQMVVFDRKYGDTYNEFNTGTNRSQAWKNTGEWLDSKSYTFAIVCPAGESGYELEGQYYCLADECVQETQPVLQEGTPYCCPFNRYYEDAEGADQCCEEGTMRYTYGSNHYCCEGGFDPNTQTCI